MPAAKHGDENAPRWAEGWSSRSRPNLLMPRIDEIHPGDVIAGKYRVRTILGRNNGLLLEGFHTEFDQRVVIKILLASQGEDRALERFRREARTLAKLESEHVARIIDVGTEPDGSFYLVRQYLDGVDVSSYIRQNGPLALQDAALVILMVAEAVAETHGHGIIVRELQPDHLFLTQRAGGAPLVKITDFGTAKLMRDAAAPGGGGELTATAMFGLSPYSSPELLRKAKNVDVRTDVWSLGAIFYELITGRPPFTGETAMLMLQITKEDPPPASTLRSGIPTEVDQIISWALTKDVDARFKNVYAFAQALQPYAPPEGQVLIDRIRQITESARQKRKGGAAPAGVSFPTASPAATPTPAAAPRRPDESVTNIVSPQQAAYASQPSPQGGPMQGQGSQEGPRGMPGPGQGAMPSGQGGPSQSPATPAMQPMPVQPVRGSSPASRKVAMSALAIAAVVLPLVVLFVVLKNANSSGTTPASTASGPMNPTATESGTGVAPPPPMVTSSPVVITSTTPPPPPSSTTPAGAITASTTVKPTTPSPPPTSKPSSPPPDNSSQSEGTLLAVAVGGNCSFSVNGSSKGTSQSIRIPLKPGTYSVNCKPDSGNAQTKSTTVRSGETSMIAFRL